MTHLRSRDVSPIEFVGSDERHSFSARLGF
jgi:hypothetical protein